MSDAEEIARLTDAELEELERLDKARTPGEWSALEMRSADPRFYIGFEIRGPDPDPSSKHEWPTRVCQSVMGQRREEGDRIDFTFIAASARQLRRLLSELRALRADAERMREAMDTARTLLEEDDCLGTLRDDALEVLRDAALGGSNE